MKVTTYDGWCSNASTDNDKPNDERESSSPTCVFHESFQTPPAALNTGKFPDDTGEMTVEKQALEHYLDILRECGLNWCAFVCTVDLEMEGIAEDALYEKLLGLNIFCFSCEGKKQIVQSRQDYLHQQKVKQMEDEVASGIVVSESESEDGEQWVGVKDVLDEKGRQLIARKIKSLRKVAARQAAKKIANQRFLGKKQSKHVGTILHKFPDIGNEIERFVEFRGVGADAWRGTGVLTFDGNRKLEQKVTFKLINEHLDETYGRHFSHGTVVQLCVARNRRRLSSKRY